jgi:hypothetical protein
VTPAGAAVAGRTFEFEVVAANLGGSGGQGSITVSSPEATELSAVAGTCDMPTRVSALGPGSQVSTLGGGTRATAGRIASKNWIAETDITQNWPAGGQCTFTVRATMPATGSATFLLRAAVFAGNDDITFWPYGSGSNIQDDQQGYKTIMWTVPVTRQ